MKRKIEKVAPSLYEREMDLQRLIETHPEIISFTTLSSRVTVLAREYPVSSGSIDLLCVDEEGRIYIVETKLRRNSDRRWLIAQLLDYAAQLRKQSFNEFRAKISKKNNEKTLEDLLKDIVDEEESLQKTLDKMKANLHEGNFVLIAVMDEIEQEMKDLFTYLNQYMDIYGIELKRYQLKDQGEIFIPSIIPQLQKTPPPPPPPPPTLEQIIENYAKKELKNEIEKIIEAFKTIEASQKAKIRILRSALTLTFELPKGRIEVAFNVNPDADHGVWVNNRELYQKVYELGQKLGLETKLSDRPTAKIIKFNKREGVKKASKIIKELLSGLSEI